jgi:hypothetical protein
MAALSPVDAVLSVGQRIGRYFALVSMIPALLLVLWIYILLASGALSGTPTVHNAEYALSHWSVGKAAGVVIATLAVALILHPLQFATTQLMEGYWGATPLATTAMKIRIVHHRKRQRDLWEKAGSSKNARTERALGILRGQPWWHEDPETQEDAIDSVMEGESGDQLMRYYIAEQEALDRHASKYPADAVRILPTELGNALRCFEDAAGKQYGLSALAIAPHLHLVVPPRHLEYLIDAREDMDSAIRICTVGLIASILTVAFLLTDGLWLLWTILPYSISYLAYKGAVSAAQGYGSVVAGVIDLDRFLLYDELGVSPPRDSDEERESNRQLMQMLAGKQVTVRYRRREATQEIPARPAWRKRQPKAN